MYISIYIYIVASLDYFISIHVCGHSESVSHSVLSDSATPWTVSYQVPLSVDFSRQEYWSG